MYKRILLKQSKWHKVKYKTNLKRKKLKRIKVEMNYKFAIKLTFIIFIIFLVAFIYLKMPKMKKNQIDNKSHYFACFCAMAREENKYAIELISYYSKLGIEKFIFADNNLKGAEKLSDVLQTYINKGIVDIYELFGSDLGQAEFNQIIYKKYKKKCSWFLYFDFDEYLDIHFENNVSIVLQDFLTNKIFENCEAILFNWLTYTDNDLIYYDKRTILERFTTSKIEHPANFYVKSIVRGGLNKTIFYPKASSHVPDKNVIICDSVGTILKNYNPFGVKPPVFKYGCLKHFSTKSAEEYVNKIRRGTNRNLPYSVEERIDLYFKLNKFTEEKIRFFENKFNRTFSRIINKFHRI